MCKKGNDEEMTVRDYVDTSFKERNSTESLKCAVKEMNAKRNGTEQKRSARDMIKKIRKNMENDSL